MWKSSNKIFLILLVIVCYVMLGATAFAKEAMAVAPKTLISKNEQNQHLTKNIGKDEAYIPKGTKLAFKLQRDIIANRVKEGDEVPFILLGDVKINGITVIKNHTEAVGVVERAVHSSVYGRSGQMVIALRSLKTITGATVPLVGKEETSVAHRDNALCFGLIGGLFFKGTQASYRHGKIFYAQVAEDTGLNVNIKQLNQLNSDKN